MTTPSHYRPAAPPPVAQTSSLAIAGFVCAFFCSPIGLILKLLLNLTPHYIGIALPAAFFLAVLVAVNRMSADSELDAAQSFGIGPQRMLAPLLGLGTLLLILMIIVTGFVQPYSRYAYRALIYAITHATLRYGLEEGVFIHTEGGLTMMAEDISADRSYPFIIFRESDGAMIGGVTLANVRRGIVQAGTIGYWVGQPHAGRGYMTTALRVLLPSLFGELSLHRIEMNNLLALQGAGYRKGYRSPWPASQADLAPTLLAQLGMAAPASMTGRVLAEAIEAAAEPQPAETRVCDAQSSRHAQFLRLWRVGSTSYIDQGWIEGA